MKQTPSKALQLLAKGVLLLPLLIVMGVLLNGFLAGSVFAAWLEASTGVSEKGLTESESRNLASARLPRRANLFQSALPTPTFTPTPVPPTNTPTPVPPTDTPTPVPPTDTPVPNHPPEITKLTVPLSPVPIDQQPVTVEAMFSDPDAGDTHTAKWFWDDSTGSINCPQDSPVCVIYQENDTVSGSHTYAGPGTYEITLQITDQDGLSDEAVSDFVVVYDPDAGFVTGGGWIYSNAGWCQLDSCTSAEGLATFGFFSKYKKGATSPTGITDFNFQAGELKFWSDTYQWLVINKGGNNAQFKGQGTINGEKSPGGSPYEFMLWAHDNDPDTFRIKIWFETPEGEFVVYDPGSDQSLGGGSIIVHKGK